MYSKQQFRTARAKMTLVRGERGEEGEGGGGGWREEEGGGGLTVRRICWEGEERVLFFWREAGMRGDEQGSGRKPCLEETLLVGV